MSVVGRRLTACAQPPSARITIEAGTNVIMGVDSDIELGWNGNAVTLYAEGTPDAPIRFCGERGEPGFWRSLIIGENLTSDSVLENVLISDAGGERESLWLRGDLLVDNVQVRNGANDGVRANDFLQESSGLSVEGVERVAVLLTGPEAVTYFPLGGRLENTFEAGVDYRFAADTDLEIGWNSNDATVNVRGTADSPVSFRGVVEQPGYYRGILVQTNVRSDCVIEFAEIAWLEVGHGSPCLTLRTPLPVSNSTFYDCGTAGIRKLGSDASDHATSNVFENVDSSVEDL